MKLNDGYELCTLAGQNIIIPSKMTDVDFTRVLSLNDTAAHLWRRMSEGEFEIADLVAVLTDAYDVSPAEAESDAQALVAQLRDMGLISE